MNLAQASGMALLAKRGRQAITEKSRIVANPELHKVLKYQGFHVQSTKPGQSSYIHPKTGAKATVHEDGNWNVTYPKPAEMQKVPGKRLGKKPVAKAGAKVAAKPSLKMKVAAGGPGSGRHPGENFPKLHKAILEHGYSYVNNNSTRRASYTHPSGPHNKAHIFESGQWQVGDRAGKSLSNLHHAFMEQNISK